MFGRDPRKNALPGDYLGVVEALYELEEDQDVWLATLAERACDVLGARGVGGYALAYDASDVNDCRFSSITATREVSAPLFDYLRTDVAKMYEGNPHLVDAVFRRISYGASRDLPLGELAAPLHAEVEARFGIPGILGLNGVNLDGRGIHVGVFLAPESSPSNDVLARLSSHLAAASRLRRRLDRPKALRHADAVLEPNGKVAHAEGDAKLDAAREQLSLAVVRLEQARSSVRRRDPELALARWTALVTGQWSLVDHFDRDGKRFLVAERNDEEPGPLALLTRRERQVVALAAVGHPNKMIAYELGIAVSTAGVLLARAARKLGARSRQALIAAYRKETAGARGDDARA